MALGVYVTYKLLDIADLTVDSLCTGGATSAVLILMGMHPLPSLSGFAVFAGMFAGLVTGLLHIASAHPGHSCGNTHTTGALLHPICASWQNPAWRFCASRVVISLGNIPMALSAHRRALVWRLLSLWMYWLFGIGTWLAPSAQRATTVKRYAPRV